MSDLSSHWQTIDSAPKAADLLSGWSDPVPFLMFWHDGRQCWVAQTTGQRLFPTHWMAAPTAPRSES